jgi:hypothetical protein
MMVQTAYAHQIKKYNQHALRRTVRRRKEHARVKKAYADESKKDHRTNAWRNVSIVVVPADATALVGDRYHVHGRLDKGIRTDGIDWNQTVSPDQHANGHSDCGM